MTNQDEDQDWLDALAGKPNPNADPNVTRRATLLRQAIRRHDAALGVNDFDVEAGLKNLKVRMRSEGLYVTLGKYDEALPLFQRAYHITLASRMPDALRLAQVNLGDLYTKQGNVSAAIFFLKGAVNSMQGNHYKEKIMNYIEDQMKELMDRSRRIETKLTRMINGEVDKGVTIVDYRLAHCGDWQLELRSQSITLAQIAKILEDEGVPQGDRVAVFDNDRYMLTVAV